jgi:hypothetical protein
LYAITLLQMKWHHQGGLNLIKWSILWNKHMSWDHCLTKCATLFNPYVKMFNGVLRKKIIMLFVMKYKIVGLFMFISQHESIKMI